MGKRIRLSSLEGIVGNRALVQARLGLALLEALLRRRLKRKSEGRLKKTLLVKLAWGSLARIAFSGEG